MKSDRRSKTVSFSNFYDISNTDITSVLYRSIKSNGLPKNFCLCSQHIFEPRCVSVVRKCHENRKLRENFFFWVGRRWVKISIPSSSSSLTFCRGLNFAHRLLLRPNDLRLTGLEVGSYRGGKLFILEDENIFKFGSVNILDLKVWL